MFLAFQQSKRCVKQTPETKVMIFQSFPKMISIVVVTGYPIMLTGHRKTVTYYFQNSIVVTGYPHMVTDYPSRTDPEI